MFKAIVTTTSGATFSHTLRNSSNFHDAVWRLQHLHDMDHVVEITIRNYALHVIGNNGDDNGDDKDNDK